MMHSYFVYGLGIHSNLEIPQLVSAPVEADVTIQFDPETASMPELDPTHQGYLHLDPTTSIIFDRKVGLFRLFQGREITIQPTEIGSLKRIQTLMVGTILTVLLYQRGILVLHGSAIADDQGVVGFIGSSGRGKSSIAAALYARGYRLLSDDAIPIQFKQGVPYVLPGYPHFKISQPVANCLGYNVSTLVAYHPESDEASFIAIRNFASTPLPLKQLYVLDPQDEIEIAPLSGRDAFISILQESLPTMWRRSQSAQEFLQCMNLIKTVPFYRLTRSQHLASLPELASQVEAHCLQQRVPS